jgi:hypothetical protein
MYFLIAASSQYTQEIECSVMTMRWMKRDFSVCHYHFPGTHPAPYPVDTGGCFPVGNVDGV